MVASFRYYSTFSGYELFMIDKTLDESDLQLLDPGLYLSLMI